MTSSQSETCVKLCSTYCCTALPTPDFYWNFERTEDIQAWSLGKVSMLSAWAGNDVGTSTWLVSVQFQNSAKGIWEKQGHAEHSSPALQGGNPLLKGTSSFSCSAPRLIAGKPGTSRGVGQQQNDLMGDAAATALFLSKSTCGQRKRSHFHAECRDGAIPPACAGGDRAEQVPLSQVEIQTLMDEAQWNFSW